MDLSDGQFQEHLDAFKSRLDVGFGKDTVEVAGRSYPTTSRSIHIVQTPDGGMNRYLYAHIPSESGATHLMTARTTSSSPKGEHPHYWDTVDFNIGHDKESGSAWLQPHGDRQAHRDPSRFHHDVQRAMKNTPPPKPEQLEANRQSLQAAAQNRGKLNVSSELYNKSVRHYHFDIGAGRLTDR